MKIPVPPKLVKFALSIADLEAGSDSAMPDPRLYEYSWVISHLARLPIGNLLDIGCTASMNLIPATLCNLDWKVYGLDIREFKYQHDNFTFVKSIDELPQDTKFQTITAVSSLEHFGMSGRYGIKRTDTGVARQVVNQAIEKMADDGAMFITVPFTPDKWYIKDSMIIYDRELLDALVQPLKIVRARWVRIGEHKEKVTMMVKAKR